MKEVNKKTLATRLASIEHYGNQMAHLRETIKETESVREDLIKSLTEFFPFEYGDTIKHEDNIILFGDCKAADIIENDLRFCVQVSLPEAIYGKTSWTKFDNTWFYQSEVSNMKLLYSKKED